MKSIYVNKAKYITSSILDVNRTIEDRMKNAIKQNNQGSIKDLELIKNSLQDEVNTLHKNLDSSQKELFRLMEMALRR